VLPLQFIRELVSDVFSDEKESFRVFSTPSITLSRIPCLRVIPIYMHGNGTTNECCFNSSSLEIAAAIEHMKSAETIFIHSNFLHLNIFHKFLVFYYILTCFGRLCAINSFVLRAIIKRVIKHATLKMVHDHRGK